MYKFAYLLVVSLSLCLASSFAWGDCVDLSKATNWSNINTHKIILYRGSKAIAVLDIPACEIYPSSNISLDKEHVCNGDKIIVSGVACDIHKITIP